MDLGLEGKVCVVTGASRGIGLAVADKLSAEGAQVLLVARDEEAIERAATEVAGEFLACDVTDPDEDFEEQWQLHVMAPFRLMSEAAPRMAARGGGRIVNVSSSSGKRPGQRNVAYSVTKAAQLSLSRAFADRWAGENVLVNAVTPGPVASELWTGPGGLGEQIAGEGKAQEAIAAAAEKVPLGRFGEPEEIADVIAFLCSARASNVTGAAWSADGGAVPVII